MQLKKEISILRIEILKSMNYKAFFWYSLINPFISFGVQFFLWNTVYLVNDEIGGYTKYTMIMYFFWSSIMAILTNSDAVELGNDIKNGNIDRELLRPISLVKYRFWMHIGKKVPYIILALLLWIVYLGYCIITKQIDGSVWSLYFVCVAIVINYFVNLLIGLLAIYIEEVWVVNAIITFLKNTLAGYYIPLSLMPTSVLRFLNWTPLSFMCYIPVESMLNRISKDMIIIYVIVSVVWMVVLHFGVQNVVNKLLKKYNSACG